MNRTTIMLLALLLTTFACGERTGHCRTVSPGVQECRFPGGVVTCYHAGENYIDYVPCDDAAEADVD